MTESYGHKWTTPMGEVPNQTWLAGLRDLGQPEWMAAIKVLNASQDEWPPSLPEFKRWALGGKTTPELKEEAARGADRLLAEKVAKYNPNVIPMNNQQAERYHDRVSRSLYVDNLDKQRNYAMGIEHIERDPLRICPDEEYR
jgi:hypothetical protein